MDTYRDFVVGLFMLVSIGIVVGLFLLSSNALEGKRQSFYMRANTANGLSGDTRVFLQGLQVGRVTQIIPRVDSSGLIFVAQLSLQVAYPDGTPLNVPVGTRAVIAEPSPISAAEVRLEPPEQTHAVVDYLQPGDTIESTRLPGAVDLLADLSTELKDEVLLTLQQTRALMAQSMRTLSGSEGVIAATQEVLSSTTPKVDEALQLLATSLEKTNEMLADVSPRIAPFHDSLTVTLAQARELMSTLDTLATDASVMLAENRDIVRQLLEHLTSTTLVLENFTRQVTRRPLRLLTGVKPPAVDTTGPRP